MKAFKPKKIVKKSQQEYGLHKTTTAKQRMMVIDDRLPSKQYIKARIEDNVKDDTFGAAWDGDTTSAPSRNAVYDYIGSLASTSDVWGVESAAASAKTRSRKSGNVGIGDASNMAFTDVTHKLTVDGDLRIGAGISTSADPANTNKDIYLDDGAILYKYGSSGSTAMLTLNSSTGHLVGQNLAIGSTAPNVPLEINIAESDALTTADGTGLFQIGNDSGANIGMNSTKIQARSGGSASKLNLNVGGGNIDMGSSASTITSKGNLAVEGNLTVTGTATSISTETVTVFDNFIELNSNYEGTSPTESAGIEINRGGSTAINPILRWNETDDKWQLSEAVTGSASYKDIIHTGQTGSVTNAMLGGSIANNKLANDSVTVGTTEIDLGASSTTLAGLTAVTVAGTSGAVGTTALNITGGNSSATNPAVNITGHLVASTKSFNIPHPIHDDKRLVYGCLEGPEHGVYFRGTAEFDLAPERMPVELPEYWFKLVGEDYTISITPHGPYHVWVDEKFEDGFFVESSSETHVKFDWMVLGGRKDATIPEVEPQAP